MADLQELLTRQRDWPVQWRWEGQSGHPRRLADAIAQMLEDYGYLPEVAESDIKGEPLSNVAEFEGSAIGLARESRREAVRRKWGYLAAGVLLAPVIVGVFLVLYALKPRRYHVALHWRGEMYGAEAHAEGQGLGAQRANVVSEVRLTLRSAAEEGDAQLKGVDLLKLSDAMVLPQLIEAGLPRLALRPAAGAPHGAQALSGARPGEKRRIVRHGEDRQALPPGRPLPEEDEP